jgi:starvation-inducible DNA-binding protein
MHQTKNDISLETRTKVVALLNARLADAIDLTLQGKQAHWNVKGPQFIALHELFDKVVESAEDWVDDLAERVVALGGVAEGTVGAVGKKTTLAAYPMDITDGPEHVDALSSALAKFGKGIRAAIDDSDKLGDKDSADLFTGISRDSDKYLWFLEAHLQGKR